MPYGCFLQGKQKTVAVDLEKQYISGQPFGDLVVEVMWARKEINTNM